MAKIGILTEKAKAKEIFKQALNGKLKNGVVQGNYNGDDFVITSASGHIYQLKDPQDQVKKDLQKKYSSWAIENLPWNPEDFNWKLACVNSKIAKQIKADLADCTEIVIATDSDPSGEGALIAGEILFSLGLIKGKKITRAVFPGESVATFKKAYDERHVIANFEESSEYLKALFRSHWDFLSMQHTRVITSIFKDRAVLRTGRLKGAMISLVGEALDKYKNHKEEFFYTARYIDENKIVYIDTKAKKYKDSSEVPIDSYKPSSITLDKIELKQAEPPKLYNISKLDGILSSRFSSVAVKNTYQKMYEAEYVSYPRTQDRNITEDQFRDMLPLVDSIAKVVDVDTKILTHRKPRKTHVFNKGSHGANRPGMKVPNSIAEIESKFGIVGVAIYKILARSFLSMFAENYEYERQTGHVTDYPEFKGSANIPKKAGWKAVLGKLEEDSQEYSSLGLGKLGKPFVHKGEKPRPPYPTASWLYKQLESHNVGTGSTQQSTLIEITSEKHKYPLMTNVKGKLDLTLYGDRTYQLTKGTQIASVKLTEKIWETINGIGEGKHELAKKELDNFKDILMSDLAIIRENAKNVKAYEFPKVEKASAKDSNGEDVEFNKIWNKRKFTQVEIDSLIKGLVTGELTTVGPFNGKKGSKYNALGKLEWYEFKGKKIFGFKPHQFQNIKK